MWNRIYRLFAVMSIAMMGAPSAFEASARVVNRSLSRVQSEVNAGEVPVAQRVQPEANAGELPVTQRVLQPEANAGEVPVAQTPDTLNILSAHPSGSEENVTVLSSGVRITGLHSGKKVEGTLTYKRGYIFTSDNQPISISDAGLYFSPADVVVYKKNVKVFSSGRKVLSFGAGGALLSATGALVLTEYSTDNREAAALLVLGTVAAVAVMAPCTLVGVPMQIKAKARLKSLVRKYNSAYIFGSN